MKYFFSRRWWWNDPTLDASMHVSRIFCEKQKCQHNWPMSVLISTSDMLITCNSISTDCSSQTLALHSIVRTPCKFAIALITITWFLHILLCLQLTFLYIDKDCHAGLMVIQDLGLLDPYVSTILNNFCSAENNSKHSIQHVFTICTVVKLVIFQSEKLVIPMFSSIDMLLMRML